MTSYDMYKYDTRLWNFYENLQNTFDAPDWPFILNINISRSVLNFNTYMTFLFEIYNFKFTFLRRRNFHGE